MFRFILVLHWYNAQAVLDKLDFYLDINYHEEIMILFKRLLR